MTEISGRDGGNRASFESGDVEGGGVKACTVAAICVRNADNVQ